MIDLVLPYPPSVNHYWIHTKKGLFVGEKGKEYRIRVNGYVRYRDIPTQEKKLRVTVCQYLPDRRKRDIDNIFKALFDALTYAKVWNDDSQIYELKAYKIDFEQHLKKGGQIKILIEEV